MTRRYDLVVGTGGIGSGIFLALEGNRTLGREESRQADLLERRDYCKLHIVCHYLRQLLGDGVPVVPIGKVGQDGAGRALMQEMHAAGLDTAMVTSSSRPTLLAVCFQYPDGDGGNLTTNHSASAEMRPRDVQRASPMFEAHRGRGVALGLPQVPLDARQALLQLASDHGWLRVAAVVPGELEAVRSNGMLTQVDVLALNIEEVAILASTPSGEQAGQIARAVVEALAVLGSPAHVVMTAGARGSWTWDRLAHVHAPASGPGGEIISRAGAGDAHLSGIVVGLVAGLDLTSANVFAAIVSGLKGRNAHTINPDISPETVLETARRQSLSLPAALLDVLAGAPA